MHSARNYSKKKTSLIVRDNALFAFVLVLSAVLFEMQRTVHLNTSIVLQVAESICSIVVLLGGGLMLKKMHKMKPKDRNDIQFIDAMSGVMFEDFIANLLPNLGYTHIVLTERYDLGIDILCQKHGIVWGIQTKRQKEPVKLLAVRQVVAALQYYDCHKAMVISNATYTKSARKLAQSNGCILIDGKQLQRWLRV